MRSAEFEVVEEFDRGGDFFGGALSLNAGGNEYDFQRGVAALHDVQDVQDGRAVVGEVTMPITLRIAGAGDSFAFGGEQAFGVELLFKFLERRLQCADALQRSTAMTRN